MKATLLIMTLILSLNVFAEGESDKSDCSKTKAQSERTEGKSTTEGAVDEASKPAEVKGV